MYKRVKTAPGDLLQGGGGYNACTELCDLTPMMSKKLWLTILSFLRLHFVTLLPVFALFRCPLVWCAPGMADLFLLMMY